VICVGCGNPLHPERRYPYCTAPACVAAHYVPVQVMAVGVNKASDQFLAVTPSTQQAVASGATKDPRRASWGARAVRAQAAPVRVVRARPPARPALPGTPAHHRLVRLWRSQGLTPAQMVERLQGQLTVHQVTQIALSR
jgi:hypothetical protein